MIVECSKCRGKGVLSNKVRCSRCGGHGTLGDDEELSVKPAKRTEDAMKSKTESRARPKKDDFIRYRDSSELSGWTYGICTDDGTSWHQCVNPEWIPKGATIHQCVWKNRELEVRRTYVKKDGPDTYNPPPPLTLEELHQKVAGDALERATQIRDGMQATRDQMKPMLDQMFGGDSTPLIDEVVSLFDKDIERLKKVVKK